MPAFVKHERAWQHAKNIVKKQYPDKKGTDFWRIATTIYKKMHPEDMKKTANYIHVLHKEAATDLREYYGGRHGLTNFVETVRRDPRFADFTDEQLAAYYESVIRPYYSVNANGEDAGVYNYYADTHNALVNNGMLKSRNGIRMPSLRDTVTYLNKNIDPLRSQHEAIKKQLRSGVRNPLTDALKLHSSNMYGTPKTALLQDAALYDSWISQLPDKQKLMHGRSVVDNNPNAYDEYNAYKQRLVDASLNPIQTKRTNAPAQPAGYMPSVNADGTRTAQWMLEYNQYTDNLEKDPAAYRQHAKMLLNNNPNAYAAFEQHRLDKPENAKLKDYRSKQYVQDAGKFGLVTPGNNGAAPAVKTSFIDYHQVREQMPQTITRPKGKGNYRIDNNWYNSKGEQIGITDKSGNFVQQVSPISTVPKNEGIIAGTTANGQHKTYNYTNNTVTTKNRSGITTDTRPIPKPVQKPSVPVKKTASTAWTY